MDFSSPMREFANQHKEHYISIKYRTPQITREFTLTYSIHHAKSDFQRFSKKKKN